MRLGARRLRPLTLLAALAALAAPARANMASPVQPGAPAGEPPRVLDGLRVVHERLTLDLRPLTTERAHAVVDGFLDNVASQEARAS